MSWRAVGLAYCVIRSVRGAVVGRKGRGVRFQGLGIIEGVARRVEGKRDIPK